MSDCAAGASAPYRGSAGKSKLARQGNPTYAVPMQDDVASLNNALEIQRKMAGLVELVVLEDTYHMITLDKQRQLVLDKTTAFAQSIERKRAVRSRDVLSAPAAVRFPRRLGG